MRIFALSDIHADFEPNARWLRNLSFHDYQADVLILAGDVTDSLPLLEWSLQLLARRFQHVLFVPGNHELWTLRDSPRMGSFEKFERIQEIVRNSGASMQTFRTDRICIVPLQSWYDYSFGTPSNELSDLWMDFRACTWPPGCEAPEITRRFLALNEGALQEAAQHEAEQHAHGQHAHGQHAHGQHAHGQHAHGQHAHGQHADDHTLISFSHFLPRAELVSRRGALKLDLSPVLGSALLDRQVRQLRPAIHVYGHSHVNRRLEIDSVTYVNNAFGYPHESAIAAKRLVCLLER